MARSQAVALPRMREPDLRETKRLRYVSVMPQIILDDYNLAAMERRLCVEALNLAGNIVGAAQLLGVTRHALKRRIVKYRIDWTRSGPDDPPATPHSG
jgi:transcriptional regulator with GAF, ATPase, and Fis domain